MQSLSSPLPGELSTPQHQFPEHRNQQHSAQKHIEQRRRDKRDERSTWCRCREEARKEKVRHREKGRRHTGQAARSKHANEKRQKRREEEEEATLRVLQRERAREKGRH